MKHHSSQWEYTSGMVTWIEAGGLLTDMASKGWEPLHLTPREEKGDLWAAIIFRRPFKHPKGEPTHGQPKAKGKA